MPIATTCSFCGHRSGVIETENLLVSHTNIDEEILIHSPRLCVCVRESVCVYVCFPPKIRPTFGYQSDVHEQKDRSECYRYELNVEWFDCK